MSLILLCFVIGCDKAGSPVTAPDQSTEQSTLSPSEVQTEVQNLEGEEIYRAFAFARGPVVDLFPDLFGDITNYETIAAMSADEAAKYAEHIEGVSKQEIADAWENRDVTQEKLNKTVSLHVSKVIDEIRTENPGYFDELKRKMKSGDHLQVQKALASITEVTIPALAEVLGISEDALRSQTRDPEINAVVVGMVAVAVAVAVALAVAAESVVTKTHVTDVTSPEASNLENEVIVDKVVDRLAGPPHLK